MHCRVRVASSLHRVVQPKPVAPHRHQIGMLRVDLGQALAEPAHQRIDRLLRNPFAFAPLPDRGDNLLPIHHLPGTQDQTARAAGIGAATEAGPAPYPQPRSGAPAGRCADGLRRPGRPRPCSAASSLPNRRTAAWRPGRPGSRRHPSAGAALQGLLRSRASRSCSPGPRAGTRPPPCVARGRGGATPDGRRRRRHTRDPARSTASRRSAASARPAEPRPAR